MKLETELIAARLLKCHATIRANKTPQTVSPNDLLPYGKMCEEAGVPHITRVVGTFLGELAEWCAKNELPPLNSLAINADAMKPGPGYKDAVGCSELNWWKEVQECIAAEYPSRIS